jgi:hypothetical protein
MKRTFFPTNKIQKLDNQIKIPNFGRYFNDMGRFHNIKTSWIIHIFAILHAVVALGCRAAGFEDERAYQLARLPDDAVNDIEARLKKYGEQRTSLADQTSSLRRKLAGKEKIDLSGLEQRQRDWKAKRIAAEQAEAALAGKLALHDFRGKFQNRDLEPGFGK